jgi:hypothetical protein
MKCLLLVIAVLMMGCYTFSYSETKCVRAGTYEMRDGRAIPMYQCHVVSDI